MNMEKQEIYNASLEVLRVIEYFEPDISMKIPQDFKLKLKELASKATNYVAIDTEKSLSEQNISEIAKDLIALIYYSYIATDTEKITLKECWYKNR